MTSAGLTPTDQIPASAIAVIDLEDRTVTDVWRTLFDRAGVRDAFIHAIRGFTTGRTIHDLYDALEDGQMLRDELVEWGQRLQDLTVDLRNGEYGDRDSFRSTIMHLAHGLAGSIIHLLDVVGVDVVLERAGEIGMGESTAEHEIEKFKQKGEVYEPKTDHLRSNFLR